MSYYDNKLLREQFYSKLEELREFAPLDFKPIGWIKSNPVEDTCQDSSIMCTIVKI